jgi:Domain of unknown function (DUF362)
LDVAGPTQIQRADAARWSRGLVLGRQESEIGAMHEQRRHFLKVTAAGAASLAFGTASKVSAAWPRSSGVEINPRISNMRVVACQDSAMIKRPPAAMTFAAENAEVDTGRVHANMDAMAMQLARVASPEAAWKTIFRSSNPWASTRVAIKLNVTEVKNMPRLAVLEKICRVFVALGVPASNIVLYHGGANAYGANIASYAPYFSSTDSEKLPGIVSKVNDALGGTTQVRLPDGSSVPCTADIARGKVDILVNVAVNKGHPAFGRASLCMKNHFGTFPADYADTNNYIININKSDPIIGGSPPRQQLCIVDSLIANKAANRGTPDAMPGYLVMGTFAPAVDYQTVKKIREQVMGATHDAAVVDSYLTRFGYTGKDPKWILVPPAIDKRRP